MSGGLGQASLLASRQLNVLFGSLDRKGPTNGRRELRASTSRNTERAKAAERSACSDCAVCTPPTVSSAARPNRPTAATKMAKSTSSRLRPARERYPSCDELPTPNIERPTSNTEHRRQRDRLFVRSTL